MTITYEPPEVYRGIRIHAFQTRERIERRVKPEIDRVMGLSDIGDLFRYCGDISWPPEARMLAGAMLEAIFNQAVGDRRERPNIDIALVRAHVAGLEEGSLWQSPWCYGSLASVDRPGNGPKSERRPEKLTDEQLERGRRGQP